MAWLPGAWRRAGFWGRRYRALGLDAALAAAGVALLAPGQSGIKDAIGALCTAVGTVRFVQALVVQQRRHRRVFVRTNPDFGQVLAGCRWPPGFAPDTAHAPTPTDLGAPYLTDPDVNAALDAARCPLSVRPDRYQVPDWLDEQLRHSINWVRPHDNQPKLGLRTDPTAALLRAGGPVAIQHTDYFSGAATNEVASRLFEARRADRRGRPRVVADVSRAMVEDNRLIGLDRSELSNHVGVSLLVLSADHEVVLQQQGDQNVSAGEASAGASGSLDGPDLGRAGDPPTLQQLCRAGMVREAAQELGAAFAGGADAVLLTGYARYLARGGKPEFFGIARSTTMLADMRWASDEDRYVRGIEGVPFAPDAGSLRRVIDALLADARGHGRHSASGIVCLRLARAWLERADAAALCRLGLPPAPA